LRRQNSESRSKSVLAVSPHPPMKIVQFIGLFLLRMRVNELLHLRVRFERRSFILITIKMSESVARPKISDEKFLSRSRKMYSRSHLICKGFRKVKSFLKY
jgi:hypothetical protein